MKSRPTEILTLVVLFNGLLVFAAFDDTKTKPKVETIENEEEKFCSNRSPAQSATCRGKICQYQELFYLKNTTQDCQNFRSFVILHDVAYAFDCKHWDPFRQCKLRTYWNNPKIPTTWRGSTDMCRFDINTPESKTCSGRLCYYMERFDADGKKYDCGAFLLLVRERWPEYYTQCSDLAAVTHCRRVKRFEKV